MDDRLYKAFEAVEKAVDHLRDLVKDLRYENVLLKCKLEEAGKPADLPDLSDPNCGHHYFDRT